MSNLFLVFLFGGFGRGGTIHMEVIANATTKAMLDVQLKTSTPVVFGVLTVFSIDQARERAESDLGALQGGKNKMVFWGAGIRVYPALRGYARGGRGFLEGQ